MIGIGVTRELALRELAKIEREVLAEIEAFAKAGAPVSRGTFALWVDNREERLAVLEALTRIVHALPSGAVLTKAELEANSRT